MLRAVAVRRMTGVRSLSGSEAITLSATECQPRSHRDAVVQIGTERVDHASLADTQTKICSTPDAHTLALPAAPPLLLPTASCYRWFRPAAH